MKKGQKITAKIKADIAGDIMPDAQKIADKYSMVQAELLFAAVKCIKSKAIK